MIQNDIFYFVASVLLSLIFLSPSPLFPYGSEIRVQAYTLSNGLRLLMLERHLIPTVSIYIRYRTGAVDEKEGKTRTAHLFEHMMFKGTENIGTRNYPREEKILREIEAVGVSLDQEMMKGNAAAQ
jgi:predicted Zn-dependent peptidase